MLFVLCVNMLYACCVRMHVVIVSYVYTCGVYARNERMFNMYVKLCMVVGVLCYVGYVSYVVYV